jgi:hypothetical protein
MPNSRSAMVVVVGTSHTIQTADPQLKPFLEGLCQQFMVHAVAEEMNQEALAEQSCTASIPMKVASALKLAHRLCDPNRAQRRDLGIRQENDIRVSAFPATLPESEVALRVAESHAKRERHWLDQLRDLNTWPVLFVCGADHVASFSQLLKQQGMAVQVAAEDWASNSTVGRDAPQAARPHCER